jgi:cellobiose-specific phosphotransferase system component IIB
VNFENRKELNIEIKNFDGVLLSNQMSHQLQKNEHDVSEKELTIEEFAIFHDLRYTELKKILLF